MFRFVQENFTALMATTCTIVVLGVCYAMIEQHKETRSKITNLVEAVNEYNLTKFASNECSTDIGNAVIEMQLIRDECRMTESVIVPQCSNRQMEELLDNAFDQGYRLGAE